MDKKTVSILMPAFSEEVSLHILHATHRDFVDSGIRGEYAVSVLRVVDGGFDDTSSILQVLHQQGVSSQNNCVYYG